MGGLIEPLPIAFANTRSSATRDRIATPDQLREWAAAWPSLEPLLARVPADGLPQLHAQRDATQAVLHALAVRAPPPSSAWRLATAAARGDPPYRIALTAAAFAVTSRRPLASARHLLAQATVQLVLTMPTSGLRRCAGTDCRKVFVTGRQDRLWCDSLVCGNRARVAAHARRQHT
jgi:predicted RNA-binding Zn ribbon-like protein